MGNKNHLPAVRLPQNVQGQYAPDELLRVFRDVISAQKEYAITKEVETTKRVDIAARLQATLEEISLRREAFASALERDFKFREQRVRELFERLDKAMASGNDAVTVAALSGIESIVKESPVGAALEALAKSFQKVDGVIDI